MTWTTPRESFTHHARFWGLVPCYWNDDTHALGGTNLAWDVLLVVVIQAYEVCNWFSALVLPEWMHPGYPIDVGAPFESEG